LLFSHILIFTLFSDNLSCSPRALVLKRGPQNSWGPRRLAWSGGQQDCCRLSVISEKEKIL
jgi:hypothetical protein